MVTIDLENLQGWNGLPDGTYDITVGAKADGYTRIIQSEAVSVVKESPIPQEEYFLTFSSPNSFTLNVAGNTKHWDGTVEYSTDKTNWNTWDGTTSIVAVNDGTNYNAYLRGINNTIFYGTKFSLNGTNISCNGNIETLLDYQTVANGQHPPMAYWCYQHLFDSCESLITAPELPATTLVGGCYQFMFAGCTSLITAPALPATTLASGCYESMFMECESLYVSDTQTTEASQEWRIPTNAVISGSDYEQSDMFAGCLGTRASDDLAGEAGQQYIYYTQNQPVGNN